MKESIFAAIIATFLPKLQRLVEKVNDKRKDLDTYLHKTMLRMVYSPDNTWSADTVNTTYVAADYVSEDSEAPIKKRDTIATSSGKLPKVAIAKTLRESDMTALRIMRAQGGNKMEMANRLSRDPIACARGIDELNEYAFLYGLYWGYVAMPDEENPGKLLRMNYMYPKANHFYATTKGEIDLDDIKNVIEKANERDGDTIEYIAISKVTYDKLRKTRKARQLVADYNGQTYTEDTQLPVPSPNKFDAAFEDDTNVKFNVINRTVRFEQNGVRKKVKPFGDDRLVFYCNDQVGALVYGRLAEQDNPVEGVQYSTVDNFKLIARFRKTDPLAEKTTGQAFVAPVIEDVDQIYVLDLTGGAEVDETEEAKDSSDAKVTINGKTYTKASVIAALKKHGISIRVDSSDENVIKAFNSLSEEDAEAVLADSTEA